MSASAWTRIFTVDITLISLMGLLHSASQFSSWFCVSNVVVHHKMKAGAVLWGIDEYSYLQGYWQGSANASLVGLGMSGHIRVLLHKLTQC